MVQFFKHKPVVPGLCCVNIQADSVSIAKVLREPEKTPLLQVSDYDNYTGPAHLSTVLKTLVEKHQLQNAKCSWVLQPRDYRLLSLEALPVPEHELLTALRWRIKDLIDFPAENAIIDFFKVPKATEKSTQMLYVIAAQAAPLAHRAKAIEDAGLQLTTIDIPELALRNINALLSDDQQGLGTVLVRPAGSELIITREQTLYLTRNIELQLEPLFLANGEDPATTQSLMNRLALEIQRSFDYYQSQLHQAAPAKLLLTRATAAMINQLSSQLQSKIDVLNLNNLLAHAIPLTDEMQTRCLIAIGGALREEDTHAPTN